mgnify:FL=1
MRFTIFFTIFVLLFGSLAAQVNGEIETTEGKIIVKVWGSHYERGEAHGYLLSEEIMDIYNQYVISYLFNNNSGQYEYARGLFMDYFNYETKYQNEAEGIIDGMELAGQELYVNSLDRELDHLDVLMANSVIDILYLETLSNKDRDDLFGCSSISSWGDATIDDSELEGELLITRFMDWSTNDVLEDNPIMLISFPEEDDEQPWLSFTYPSMFGSLSAINSSGIATFLNIGNNHDANNYDNIYPVLLSGRNAIEMEDYNNDGDNTIFDIYDAINDHTNLSGSLSCSGHC